MFVCLFVSGVVCLGGCLFGLLACCFFVSGVQKGGFEIPATTGKKCGRPSCLEMTCRWEVHLCSVDFFDLFDFRGLGGWWNHHPPNPFNFSEIWWHREALRMVAHLVYFTALQTRALLECFQDLQGGTKFFCFMIGFSRLRSYFTTQPKLVLER